jgi:ParB-like chromosome segregation protein Spo0J
MHESFSPMEIVVPHRLRDIVPEAVDAMVESIKVIGLQTPLTVRWDKDEDGDDAVVLVAGRHRLEACTRLGMQLVECAVFEGSETDARLWEIAENLHDAGLTEAQRRQHIALWVELTAEKVSHGGTPPAGGTQPHEQAIRKAAKELNIPKSTVARAVAAERLDERAKQAADAIKLGTVKRAEIARDPSPEAQLAAVQAEGHRRTSKPTRETVAIQVPRDLVDRARHLAGVEGIDIAAFVIRAVEDVVGAMEAANAEIDTADAQPVKQFDDMTNAERLEDGRQLAREGIMRLQIQPERPAPEKTPKPMSVAETARLTLERMGAIPRHRRSRAGAGCSGDTRTGEPAGPSRVEAPHAMD